MNRLSRSMSWNESGRQDARRSTESVESLGGSQGSWVPSPRLFFLPLHYEANYKYPLLVWLHSDGFNESQINHVIPHVSLRNYVAVGVRGTRAADATAHRFDWPTSSAAVGLAHDAVSAAIEEASDRYSVHPERVVLAGYRSGGAMALRVALRDPERFAGVISLGGELPENGAGLANFGSLRRRRLPMLWQWATEGTHFDPERLEGDMRTAMMMRASVEIRQYIDDDEMTNVCLADANAWIMRRIVGGDLDSELDAWSSSPTSFSAN